MKFTWLSNASWGSTGYGDQTKLIIEGLKRRGHDPAIIAFYGLEGGILNWGGVPVFPKGHMPYGQDIAAAHTTQYGAKYLFSLIDAWVFNNTPFYDSVAQNRLRWIPYFPVDCDPIPPFVKVAIERAYKRIVFSQFAARQMDNINLQYDYIPHCVDTNILKPVDRKQAREAMKAQGLNIPADAFVFGMVAANKGNPSRKGFAQQIEAFSRFKKKHNDSLFYIHTTTGERGEFGGVNLPELCKFYGLEVGKDVLFPDQYAYYMGFPKEYLSNIYSMMDVHLLVSTGEGFGIPIVEAQACGTPVIVGDWTAMSELCFSGWKLPQEEADTIWLPLASRQFAPRVAPMVQLMEQAYNRRGDESLRSAARIGAAPYDVESVLTDYWMPYLKQLQDSDEAAAGEIAKAKQTISRRLTAG